MIIIDDDGIMHKVLPYDVLDKIRAEIKQEYNDVGFDDYEYASGLNRALHIIDKSTAQEGEGDA